MRGVSPVRDGHVVTCDIFGSPLVGATGSLIFIAWDNFIGGIVHTLDSTAFCLLRISYDYIAKAGEVSSGSAPTRPPWAPATTVDRLVTCCDFCALAQWGQTYTKLMGGYAS